MLDKTFLVNKIVNTLQKNEYQVFLTQGSFDIAARREHLLLIKTLLNADALTAEQALSLRAIAHFISAYPFVVALKNNREFLKKEMIYLRFELPVFTPEFFESMLVEETTAIQAAKGRHTVDINSFALREKREELNLTLGQLAESIGISKKALYEIENKRVDPTEQTVKKLEIILKIKLRMPYEMKSASAVYLQPRDDFQRKVSKEFSRIGIDNSSVYSSPFEIVGRERFSLITSLPQNTNEMKQEATTVKKLSEVFLSAAFFVTRKFGEKNVEGVPVLLESELIDIESPKKLVEIIESKTW